jgi:TM2 domain-containing membrane protein YozV
MTKTQNTVLNLGAVFIALFSYGVLKFYNSDDIQNTLVWLIFMSGLVMIINNFFYIKKSDKKYISVLAILLGIILVLYSGFILYLVFAFRKGIGL